MTRAVFPQWGEVWLADLNPRQGTEPGKVRPVVVIQTDALNPHHTSTLVCPVTSKLGKTGSLLRVRLEKGQGGVQKHSDIMVDQIRAIDNIRLRKKAGQVPGHSTEELRSKLLKIMDLS